MMAQDSATYKVAEEFLDAHPHLNPMDTYRIYIANTLEDITGVEATTIFPLLQRPQTLDNGDLLLPVSALRIKGDAPDVLAACWTEQVCNAACDPRVSKQLDSYQYLEVF